MTLFDEIKATLSTEELLCQLAEECSELSKAALKLRRVLDGANPTPKTYDECYDNLIEEWADVELCVLLINYKIHPTPCKLSEIINSIQYEKMTRWVKRLMEVYK